MTTPTYAVHGELHTDGKTVVFFGAGDIMQAMGRLNLLTPTFRKTDPPGGVQTALSWPLLVQLAHELGTAWVPGPRLQAWLRDEFARRTAPAALTIRPADPSLIPRDYQVAGAELIASTPGTLICDDPGTGKTITTLLGLMELRARGVLPVASPIVVICPNSVMDAWVEAVHKWTGLNAKAWRGPNQDRRRRLMQTRSDVYVAGYAVAARDADPTDRYAPLLQLAPSAVVVDECHWIKNPDSNRRKAVRKLANQARAVIALSGTPITHDTADLHPTLQAIDPAAWPSRERMIGRYLDVVGDGYTDTTLGIARHREPEFRMVLQGTYRRMAKADVLDQLPPKIYSTRNVTLPPAARKAYDTMKNEMLAELDNGEELPAMSVLAQLLRLLQLACASADVAVEYGPEIDELTGEEKQHVRVTLRDPSWKVDAFMEVLDERRGKQTIGFAPSRQLMELAGRRAEKAGYRVGYIIGGQTAAQRTEAIEQFQAGKLDVMCATTQAGGVGVTLTAASTVCFLQRPWSYVEAAQAEDRAHRIGSEIHESIEIVDIVAVDTIDSHVRDVLVGKAGALADLFADPRVAKDCLGGVTT